MGRNAGKGKFRFFECALSTGIILACCFSIWRGFSTPKVVLADITTAQFEESIRAGCQSSIEPNNQSFLVVLLDRSGSLILGNTPTDPNGYSTSVTKALTDLWPGEMAVIPFTGDTTSLPILGPATLADPVQRADLKQKVQAYPIGGDTPLEPAMQEALDLLHQHGTPAGSRVIVITDGNPTGVGSNDGPHQEVAIRKALIGQYCQQGIPVSAFGLTIDPNTSDGQDANRLLTDIATGTGATYNNVTGPEDLARQVVRLYAEWQGLTFTQVSGQGSNFPVSIDPFARQVAFVTFRSDSHYQISLIGPNNQPVTTGVEQSTPPDAHYEIDKLLIAGPIQPGTYTINTDGDPNAQVYALVNSPLQVQLVSPTAKSVVYANKAVTIQAQFLNGSETITPTASDGARLVAKVTLLVNGRPAGPATNDIVLTQQSNSPIFSGQTLIYNQPGQLQIELDGTYQNVPRQTSFTLQLIPPLPKPTPKSKSTPCDFTCIKNKYGLPLLGILIALILLALVLWIIRLLLIRQQNQPEPYGYITNGRANGDVDLATFKKTVISSDDLLNRGLFNFRSARFEIIFPKDGTVQIRTTNGNSSQIMIDVLGESKPRAVSEKPIELSSGRKIYIDGRKAASFESMAGKKWT